VGFDTARGDLLTVEDLAFDENRTRRRLAARPVAGHGRELAGAGQVRCAADGALLIVLAFGVRPALSARRGQCRRNRPMAAKELPAGAEAARPAPELNPAEAAELDPERIRERRRSSTR
jgi:flagellar biosynthesis/type III secretory pathway M-ring protein FliF/YscJ